MIDKIHDIVLNDRRLKVLEISETVNISVRCVWHILHECLGMKKLFARWVPRLLTADHKRARVVASEQEIAKKHNISHTCVERHLKKLGYVNKLDIWVPHKLNENQLKKRFSICDSLLKRNENDPFYNKSES